MSLSTRRAGGNTVLYPSSVRGTEFYVDSVNGSASNDGLSWSTPLITLDAAIGKCTADVGDIVYLAPLHAESEATAATSIATMDVSGVQVIGIGNGSNIPTFTLGAADAIFSISATNCRLSNVKITSSIADCAIGVSVAATADGLMIDNCVFRDGAVALELVIGINVATLCHNIKIIDNIFSTVPSGGCANAIVLAGASDNSTISGNIAFGTYSAGALLCSAAKSVNLSIINNMFVNEGADIGIACKTDTTGILRGNYLGGVTSIANALTGEDALLPAQNFVSGAANASGLLDPGADS